MQTIRELLEKIEQWLSFPLAHDVSAHCILGVAIADNRLVQGTSVEKSS